MPLSESRAGLGDVAAINCLSTVLDKYLESIILQSWQKALKSSKPIVGNELLDARYVKQF